MHSEVFHSYNVGGAEIFARECGTGKPVLFLHGNPDSSAVWSGVFAELASRGATDQLRCIAPDLPGFGRSGVPAGFGYRKQDLADFVADLLDRAGVQERVRLVVHDFGGIFGLAFAAAYPERVSGVLVHNTLFFPDYRWHFLARVWRTPVLGEFAMRTLNRTLFHLILRLGSRRLTGAQIDATYQEYTPTARATVLRLYRATDPADFMSWERHFLKCAEQVPVRVLWGRHDPFIGLQFAERFGAQSVRILEDCGHWVPLEDAVECAREVAALCFPPSRHTQNGISGQSAAIPPGRPTDIAAARKTN